MAFTTLVAKDSSGNGHDGQYDTRDGATAFKPGLVPGDLAWLAGSPSGSTVEIPNAPADWKSDFSIECWIKGPTNLSDWNTTASGTVALCFAICDPVISPIEFLLFSVTGGGSGGIIRIHGNTGASSYGVGDWFTGQVVPYDGDRHHIVITYQYVALPHGSGLAAGIVSFYLDAASQTLLGDGTTGGPSATPPPDLQTFGLAWEGASTGGFHLGALLNGMVIDEWAFYDHVLSSGSVSAHFAAGSDFATYTAAVLADSPSNYYHLDDRPPGGWHVGNIGLG